VADQNVSQIDKLHAIQRTMDALNHLVEISLVMNSTVQIEPLLHFIMESACEIAQAGAASILLMDQRTNELRFAASIGSDAKGLSGVVVPLEGSIAGSIVAEGKALIIDDVSSDPRHYSQVDKKLDFHTESILGVPMHIRDKLVGVLEVLNKREGHFSEEDVRHITIMASQAAVAIDNAQLVSALREANDELSNLDKLKTDFIAIASHELRTPLSIILGYATFLQEEAQGEASSHAQMVMQGAMTLRSLIEDMTNLSYTQSATSDLSVEDVSLAEILSQAQNDVHTIAETKFQTLIMQIPTREITVRADKLKTEMALTNVLNNAVKFTNEHGRISVSVEERPKEVWVRVTDNGMGLPANELERIFDQFHQVEDHLTRRTGGMGLGLTIARAVMEAQGGRVWAESPGPDQGSTFTIAIPLAR
jgi:signal transduction histidine kinase